MEAVFGDRPYQAACITKLRESAREGNWRILVVSPTGSGKTWLASRLIQNAVGMNKRAAFFADQVELVDQCSRTLDVLGVDHNTIKAAGNRQVDHKLLATVISKDTLYSRAFRGAGERPDLDLLIVDEAHKSLAKTWRAIMQNYPKARIIGLTATPVRADGRGLGEVYTDLIQMATYKELIEDKRIVPVRVWAPHRPNLKDVKVSGSDYHKESLAKTMKRDVLVGDLVGDWQKRAEDRKTVVFASSIEHSVAIRNEFRRLGIAAEHIDGTTSSDEREDIMGKMRDDPNLRVVCNFGVMCLDDKTEILTSEGWVGIDDMTYDHKVANWDQGRVFFATPKYIVRRSRQPDERMVVLETKRRSIRVTANHRMLYRTTNEGEFLIRGAGELVGKAVKLPVCGTAQPTAQIAVHRDSAKADRARIRSNSYMLRRRNGLSYSESIAVATERIAKDKKRKYYTSPGELSDDDCLLIGYWLGDGWRGKKKGGGECISMTQDAKDEHIVLAIDELIERLGWNCSRSAKSSVRWTIPRGTGWGAQAREGYYRLSPYLQRKDFSLLSGLNAKQFAKLILGFWMAEGSHGDGAVVPDSLDGCNTNRAMLDALQVVAVVRGFGCTIRGGKKRQPGHEPLWKILFTKRSSHAMTKYRLEFEAEPWKDERVWCVTSDTGNIITRRRGTVTVTGNTTGVDIPALKYMINARPTKVFGLFRQMAGRLMRACPGHDHCVIQDHSDCTERFGFPDEDVDWTLNTKVKIQDIVDAARAAKQEIPARQCKSCSEMFRGPVCPACGWKAEVWKVEKVPSMTPGELRELDREKARKSSSIDDKQKFWDHCIGIGIHKNYTIGQAAAMFRDKFGVWPNRVKGLRYAANSGVAKMRAREFYNKYAAVAKFEAANAGG